MNARYSEKTNIIELFGTVQELNFLSKQIQIDDAEIPLSLQTSVAPSFSDNLESICVTHVPGQLVKISARKKHMIIEGDFEKLKILSKNIESDGDVAQGYHIHIEYFESHFYLSPQSSPLIVQYM